VEQNMNKLSLFLVALAGMAGLDPHTSQPVAPPKDNDEPPSPARLAQQERARRALEHERGVQRRKVKRAFERRWRRNETRLRNWKRYVATYPGETGRRLRAAQAKP
jgi:hypothetical protein